MEKHYDTKCYELARAFLSDFQLTDDRRAKLTDSLAFDIQGAIEDFLAEEGLAS